ncbi:uncharacterized protein LOC120330618 [Styela clava]
MSDKIMILVYLLVFIIVDISGGSSLGNTLCSSDTIPDLDGAWVCDDSWLVGFGEDISDYDTFKKWNLYFELPKFYAISKIATRPSKCDPGTSVIARLSASVWDERFIKGYDENLADATQSHWITIKVPNVTSVGGLYEEYSGFARRAPYWKLTIETLAIDDHCIPKFMFYARATPSTTSPLTTVVPSTTSSATTTNPVPCTDIEESFSTWAADGECLKSPDIMLVLCKKSCKACTTKPPGTIP